MVPRYIVHFKRTDLSLSVNVASSKRTPYQRDGDVQWFDITRGEALQPAMGMDDWLVQEYHRASSFFHTLKGALQVATLDKVTVCVNPRLESAYCAAQAQLHARGLPSSEIGTFHGTNAPNLPMIQRDGFRIGGLGGAAIANGVAMGHGVYVGTTAEVSANYVRGEHRRMLLVRVLPGKTSAAPLGAADCSLDDKAVREGAAQSHAGGNGGALILACPALLLPRYVVHYS